MSKEKNSPMEIFKKHLAVQTLLIDLPVFVSMSSPLTSCSKESSKTTTLSCCQPAVANVGVQRQHFWFTWNMIIDHKCHTPTRWIMVNLSYIFHHISICSVNKQKTTPRCNVSIPVQCTWKITSYLKLLRGLKFKVHQVFSTHKAHFMGGGWGIFWSTSWENLEDSRVIFDIVEFEFQFHPTKGSGPMT